MNPLTNMKNVKKLSEQELYAGNKTSWHDQYRQSAWIFVGGLPYDLTEGDIICIFSQYGEIVNINLVRDKDSGKSKGFCFICYEDQRSTDLAVDNLNGIKVLNRTIRVDHVESYKIPKDGKKTDEETKKLYEEGCAPKTQPMAPLIKKEPEDERIRETLADQIEHEMKLPARLPIFPVKKEKLDDEVITKKAKKKKKKKKNKHKKLKKASGSSSNECSSSDDEKSRSQTQRSKNSSLKNSSSSADDCRERENNGSTLRDTKHKKESYYEKRIPQREKYKRRSRSKSPSGNKQRRVENKSKERNKYRSRSRSRSNSRDNHKHKSHKQSRSSDRDLTYRKY